MTPKTKATCERMLTGYASAQRRMLFDRQGQPGHYGEKDKWQRPQYYWCPSVMIDGKQHGVIGPNGFIGQYSRKEAVAEAQGFLDQCRTLLAANACQNGNG